MKKHKNRITMRLEKGVMCALSVMVRIKAKGFMWFKKNRIIVRVGVEFLGSIRIVAMISYKNNHTDG